MSEPETIEAAPGGSTAPAGEPRTCTAIKKDGTPCMAKPIPGRDTCPVHSMTGPRKPRKDRKDGKKPSAPRPAAPRASSLENELRKAYREGAGAIMLFEPDVGMWLDTRSGDVAAAHAALARQNPAIEAFLRGTSTQLVPVNAAIQTLIAVFGAYAIVRFKAGRLTRRQGDAALLLGVPLLDIQMRAQAQNGETPAPHVAEPDPEPEVYPS